METDAPGQPRNNDNKEDALQLSPIPHKVMAGLARPSVRFIHAI